MTLTRRGAGPLGLVLAVLLLLLPGLWTAEATEEYAEATGQECGVCHVDPSGGGDLTPLGSRYAQGGYVWPVEASVTVEPRSTASKILRLIVGYVHLLMAFAWFGTIFYVHVVLKPAYAKGGLPRTEMRLAWLAIVILALTGVPLLIYKYPSMAAMVETRSGQLLLIKIALYLFLVVSAAAISLRLSPLLKKRRSSWQDHDGEEGRPAWVKVGDKLYDVTGSKHWEEGVHFRRHQAGQDLTGALKSAPHGPEKLETFPSFSLADKSLQKETFEVRVLYVMAYVNLFVALAVLLVIAWMRWGP